MCQYRSHSAESRGSLMAGESSSSGLRVNTRSSKDRSRSPLSRVRPTAMALHRLFISAMINADRMEYALSVSPDAEDALLLGRTSILKGGSTRRLIHSPNLKMFDRTRDLPLQSYNGSCQPRIIVQCERDRRKQETTVHSQPTVDPQFQGIRRRSAARVPGYLEVRSRDGQRTVQLIRSVGSSGASQWEHPSSNCRTLDVTDGYHSHGRATSQE
ncbi:hypothetical protein C8Q74DRAFT_214470 [Fomes fomentarius]|nr:hypothetical protein C8Q74DRAFT_214470 [Fomes fomentarius]